MKNNILHSQKLIYTALSLLTLAYFLFGQGVTWYAYGGDTEAYYLNFGHHIETKPLYSLFIHVLDLIFGRPGYLYAASVIQMIFAVFCIIYLVYVCADRLGLGLGWQVLIWLASLLPFYILLPEDPIPHTIMTESFTYPLVYLFTAFILKGLWDRHDRQFIYAALVAMASTLIRGQMLLLYAVAACAYIYYRIREKKLRKSPAAGPLLAMMAVLLGAYLGQNLLTAGYEKIFFGAEKMDYSAQTMVQKAMFCADEEDAELFEDEVTRDIFTGTYGKMMEDGTNYRYMEGKLTDWKMITASFGNDSYILEDVTEDVCGKHGVWPEGQIAQEETILKYSREITDAVFRAHPGRVLYVSFKMMPAGFVSTVLFHKESIYGLIHAAAAALYILAMGGSIALILAQGGKHPDNMIPAEENTEFHLTVIPRESEFMWLIIGTAVVNVVGSNLIHFGLQRYLAYTVGLFYVGLALMIRKIICRP